jgi:peptidoglycan/LPS O-acetylase OafA/YrhL
MTTFFTTLHLLFDLLTLPFLVGAGAVAMVLWLKRRPSPRVLRAALIAGLCCAIVHALGVLSLMWRDGDWIGYAAMIGVAALMAVLLPT